MSRRMLIVCTGVKDMPGTEDKTGAWLEEFASPFWIYKDAGYDVTLASLKGGEVPLDPMSLEEEYLTSEGKKFLENEETKNKLNDTVPLEKVNASDYVAIYLAGGHGAMWDFPYNPKLNSLLTDIYMAGGVASAVCHGPSGFVGAKDAAGEALVKDKEVTGFTNEEEQIVKREKIVPFLLEDKLKELGAKFTKGEPWTSHAVCDKGPKGTLVSGQNPQSSKATARLVVANIPS